MLTGKVERIVLTCNIHVHVQVHVPDTRWSAKPL